MAGLQCGINLKPWGCGTTTCYPSAPAGRRECVRRSRWRPNRLLRCHCLCSRATLTTPRFSACDPPLQGRFYAKDICLFLRPRMKKPWMQMEWSLLCHLSISRRTALHLASAMDGSRSLVMRSSISKKGRLRICTSWTTMSLLLL